MSFAIPIQEFSRFNVSERPKTWEQLAAIAPSAPPTRSVRSRQNTGQTRQETADADGFVAFQKWYHDSMGKSVTIVAREKGQTNSFTFTVK
jgi:hypothetical protein